MNIGYLLRTFPELSQTFILQEIDELERRGHRLFLAAIYRPGTGIPSSLSRYEDRTLYWFDIDKSRLAWILRSNFRRFRENPARYLRLFRKYGGTGLSQWVKQVAMADYFVEAGVSHLHTHFAWEQVDFLRFIREMTGIPYSLTLHAADIFSEIHNLPEAVEESAFTITISDYNRRYLISEYNLPPKKIRVVHCGVNHSDFEEIADNTRNTPFVLSIGRLVPKKGFDLLLRAFQVLKEKGIRFQAWIVGDGPLRSELEQLSERLDLGEAVVFTGPMPHEAVKSALAGCDIFALPCRKSPNGDIDGIPVVLMEAMAAGRPVVSSRISGIPELVREDCGYLANPEDVVGLAHGLERLIQEPGHGRQMGKNGRAVIREGFTIHGQVEGLLKNIRNSRTESILY